MGGYGSGSWQKGKKTTSDYRSLDVRRLQRDGLLKPGHSFGWNWLCNGETVASIQIRTEADHVILNYRHRRGGSGWQDVEYPVWLDWSPCNYGGLRAWFLCPGKGCGRRVAVLYGGSYFLCRHCHRLAYESQRENVYDRMMRQAEKIRRRMGWFGGIALAPGGKPKGMRWQTFWRLRSRHDRLAVFALRGRLAQMEALVARIGRGGRGRR